MSLATYASPFEIESPEQGLTTVYSKTRANRRDVRTGQENMSNKTRRKSNSKGRDITNIIKMLHEDMSDNDDRDGGDGGDGHMRKIRDNQSRSYGREGMTNINLDDTSSSYIKDAVNTTRNAYNYTQKANLDRERTRLAKTYRNKSSNDRGFGDLQRQNVHGYTKDGRLLRNASMGNISNNATVESSKSSVEFDEDEYSYVNKMGGNLSGALVSGDGTNIFYADTRNDSTDYDHMRTHIDANPEVVVKNPRETPSRKYMQESNDGATYESHEEGKGLLEDYDSDDNATYKCPDFGLDCKYSEAENDRFEYPKWSTKNNRRLYKNGVNNAKGDTEVDEETSSSILGAASNRGSSSLSSDEIERLMRKMDYLVHMMEENEETKNNYVVEELILYCFLGFFVLFVVDSFTNVNVKYKR